MKLSCSNVRNPPSRMPFGIKGTELIHKFSLTDETLAINSIQTVISITIAVQLMLLFQKITIAVKAEHIFCEMKVSFNLIFRYFDK